MLIEYRSLLRYLFISKLKATHTSKNSQSFDASCTYYSCDKKVLRHVIFTNRKIYKVTLNWFTS